ncbi:MAG TPA: aminopeptidase [Burkholderiales bacterium]|nr:aminopeptidase [Burkholderiales bacterium]
MRKWRWILPVLVLAALAGCQSLAYYSQAIGGHLRLLAKARPVEDWLADPATPPELKQRLQTARRIREFASSELKLPDNKSYLAYADLERPFVVWNVFAAPELSVEPKGECFPFTGCVSYRGFYAEEDARRHADKLRAQGYDVYVGGVPAYSTLGWSDDPLLSTFIRYSDAQLARLLFHELAHQVVYAKNDTTFNESFAVAVEEEGVKRWLLAEGRSGELADFQATQVRKRELAERVAQTRERLALVYRSSLSREQMLEQKRGEWARLRASYPGIPAEPNNAFLVSIAVYTELVPAFERLLAKSGSFERFYDEVKKLAKSGKRDIDDLLVRRPGA